MTTVWQIGAGDRGRDYSEMLTQHDVMIMGPGRYGSAEGGMQQYDGAVKEGSCRPTEHEVVAYMVLPTPTNVRAV